MPRWLRIFFTGLSFVLFFVGGGLLGAVVAPLLLLLGLGRRERQRDRLTRVVNGSYAFFLWWMKLVGLIGYDKLEPPPELEGRSYVLVSNHPTLIDVLYLLNWFPRLTCVVKASWYRVWFFGTLLRGTHYLAGPGVAGDDVASSDAADGWGSTALDRMVEHLRAGHPLLVFPEGTRSKAARLRRFKRGPFEAARRAGVPIVPVFIHVDRPMLMK
ncbi:MAG: lysophospholipid acyltransferase family protein, partial [Polyangiales bacterium]